MKLNEFSLKLEIVYQWNMKEVVFFWGGGGGYCLGYYIYGAGWGKSDSAPDLSMLKYVNERSWSCIIQ